MIKAIGIENFKAFGDYRHIELQKLNLVSGLNSSGKSSIYQVFHLMSQSMDASVKLGSGRVPILKINGEKLTIGTKKELLNDKNKDTVKLSFTLKDNAKLDFCYKLLSYNQSKDTEHEEFVLYEFNFNVENINFSLKLDLGTFRWTVKASKTLVFRDSSFASIFEIYLRNYLFKSEKDVLYNSHIYLEDIKSVAFDGLLPGSFHVSTKYLKNCINPSKANAFNLSSFLATYKKLENKDIKSFEMSSVIGNSGFNYLMKNSIVEIPPFRGIPQRVYSEDTNPNPLHSFVATRFDDIPYRFDYDLSNSKNGTLEEALNYWIVEHFKFADQVEVVRVLSDFSTEILLTLGDKKVPINNMGFGLSQILPIIFKILSSSKGSMFIVDEPEIHLHPSAQAKLAKFFFEMAQIGKIIFLETHSEHLINNLIFEMVQKPNLSKEIKLMWVEREGTSSNVREIIFDELGYLVDPPEGFLDERTILTDKFSKFRLDQLKK